MAQDLNHIVLLGTDRAGIPEELKTDDSSEDAAVALLKAVARKALLDKGAMPLLDRAVPSGLVLGRPFSMPPKALRRALQRICGGAFRPCLPEILDLLVEHEYDLPPESWPALLDLSLDDEELAAQLVQNGHPGLGLFAAHYPEWSHVAEPDVNHWPHASLSERQAMLRALMLYGRPQDATDLLASTWPEDTAEQKAALLSVLDASIGQAATELLEEALQDRRKEVRREAARLLVGMEGSPHSKAWLDMAASCIALEDARANFHPDHELMKPWIGYGLLNKKRDDQLKAILEMTPPGFWPQLWGMSVEAAIEAFHRSIQSRVAVQALLAAGLAQSSGAMAGAWLRYWSRHSSSGHWEGKLEKGTLAIVPAADARAFAQSYLRQQKSLLAERHLITRLLLENPKVWNEQLVRMVVVRFQEWLVQATAFHWDTLHYKELLRQMAYCCPIASIDILRKGWPRDAPMWGAWEKEIEQMIRVVNFRKSYHEVD